MGRGVDQGPSGGELVGLSLFLAAAVVIPLISGLVADQALHTGPLFLFVGLILGVVAGGAGVYSRFKRYL